MSSRNRGSKKVEVPGSTFHVQASNLEPRTSNLERPLLAGQGTAGFPLLEVLIAVAILVALAPLVSVSFSSTFRILEIVRGDQGRSHLARLCLSLIADELVMARRQPTAPWVGRNAEQDGQPSDLLGFVSASHVHNRPDAPEGDQVRVLYAREGNRLLRFAVRNLYGMTLETVEQSELATGVVAFNVRYYDGAALVWVDDWDGQIRSSLPGGVMIELTLNNARNEPRIFTEWVSIPKQAS
jgi:type II secretion system protein J